MRRVRRFASNEGVEPRSWNRPALAVPQHAKDGQTLVHVAQTTTLSFEGCLVVGRAIPVGRPMADSAGGDRHRGSPERPLRFFPSGGGRLKRPAAASYHI